MTWRDFPGLEGLYQYSDDGKVRAFPTPQQPDFADEWRRAREAQIFTEELLDAFLYQVNDSFTTMQSSSSAKDSRERAPGEDYSYLRPAPEPTRQPRLIGLYSPSPGCGKTTVAKALAPYGYERISFAQPLRDMLTPFLAALDYPATALTSPIHKDTPIRELGISPRDLMRTLGTEWGRTCVNPDTWLILAGRSIDRIHLADGYVVIDDVRFPNEANFILKRGGRLWKIERRNAVPASGHTSDTSMADWDDFDEVIYNDGSLQCLIDDVASLIRYP
jgi:hypothetical protein